MKWAWYTTAAIAAGLLFLLLLMSGCAGRMYSYSVGGSHMTADGATVGSSYSVTSPVPLTESEIAECVRMMVRTELRAMSGVR